METKQKQTKRTVPRWLVALLALVILAGVGTVAAARLARRELPRLTRTDLPGFGWVKVSDPEGLIPAENHCTTEGGVTVVDDKGRGWRVEAPGWNLQWVMTNSLGAWIDAKNLKTGVIENFYLGSNADAFENCPQTLAEDLKVDTMAQWHRFLGWSWHIPSWAEPDFRAFVDTLTVEPIDRQDVGQTVALGNCLNLRQDGEFCGQPLWVGDEPSAPQVHLRYDPFFFEDDPQTGSYTSAAGLTWDLQWFEPVVGEEYHVYANWEGHLVEVILSEAQTTDSQQMLEQAEKVLDRISAREA